jgi:hypothetical protein
MKSFHTACTLLNELNKDRQIEFILVWPPDIEASMLVLILLHYFVLRPLHDSVGYDFERS